jgi:hypothetical protein
MSRLRDRWHALVARVWRLERRELAEFRVWLETTRNLIHLTGLVVVPLLIGGVTAVSNMLELLPFVLFPPLASGAFTLFSDPKGRYADPWTFVIGLTAGAVCGTVAVFTTVEAGLVDPGTTALDAVSPLAAGLATFLTVAVTWAFGVEEPSALATALLALLVPAVDTDYASALSLYVVFTALASAGVAGAFILWRDHLYERRADVLYQSTEQGDRVLVPTRGRHDETTATLAGTLAGSRETGTVVLLDTVETAELAAIGRDLLGDAESSEQGSDEDAAAEPAEAATADDVSERAEGEAVAASAERLERLAERVERRTGVDCEIVVVAGDSAGAVEETARELGCDLVVTAYEMADDSSPFVSTLFHGGVDVLAYRADDPERTAWGSVLVPVRRAGDTAHEMLEFAERLADDGRITLSTCIESEDERRRAEVLLGDLADTCSAGVETRVSRLDIESFLHRSAPHFDLVLVGASQDRSAASRLIDPPTFRRLDDIETDVGVLDRNVEY